MHRRTFEDSQHDLDKLVLLANVFQSSHEEPAKSLSIVLRFELYFCQRKANCKPELIEWIDTDHSNTVIVDGQREYTSDWKKLTTTCSSMSSLSGSSSNLNMAQPIGIAAWPSLVALNIQKRLCVSKSSFFFSFSVQLNEALRYLQLLS